MLQGRDIFLASSPELLVASVAQEVEVVQTSSRREKPGVEMGLA